MDHTVSTDLLSDLHEEVQFEHATKGQRLVNYLIDMIVCWIFMFVGGAIFAVVYMSRYIAYEGSYGSDPTNDTTFTIILYSIVYVIFVAYYTIMEGAFKGRTIGKLVTGTMALREDGNKLTWTNAFLRSLVRIIPIEPLVAIFTTYPWHDDFTSTVVVKKPM